MVTEQKLVPEQVYNVEGTGLNYKMLPKATLGAKNEPVLGTKLAKDRLTIATCSNAAGSHKIPLFVIGKCKKPRVNVKQRKETSKLYFYRPMIDL